VTWRSSEESTRILSFICLGHRLNIVALPCIVHCPSPPDEADDEEVRHACEKAEEVYELVTLPHKTCHCKCQLNDGKRCIDQFSPEDQDAIKMNVCQITSHEKNLLLGIVSCSIKKLQTTLCDESPPRTVSSWEWHEFLNYRHRSAASRPPFRRYKKNH